jgi:hypothetical protein
VKAEASAHANFRDPVGLVLRMLRSGDRAAREALVREAAQLALTPLDVTLQPFESRRLRTAGTSIQPLILIVGSSRAGTTIVYQALARYLPVTYFTNLSSLFPRAPLTASRLFLSWAPAAQGRLHNYYGNTAGLAGPNDGFHIWNRWLGIDRYRAPEALSQDTIARMRQFLAAWTETFGRPLLNKNNRNADCVGLLGRALPEALFVVVRRNPVDVAQSLLLAREVVQGDKRRKWGVLSYDQESPSDPLGYVDSVCRQVIEVERRLRRDVQTLDAGRIIEVRYEAFCADPGENLERISRAVWGAPVDTSAASRELQLRTRSPAERRVTEAELERIVSYLAGAADPIGSMAS